MTELPSTLDRRRIGLLLLPFGASALASWIGVAMAPMLLVKSPLTLVALSPLTRHLLLASPSLDLGPFLAVAAPRMFAVDPFMYVLGREYGDLAVEVLAEKMGKENGAWIRQLDRAARRVSWLMVLIWPDPLVCMLAGVARLRPAAFVVLNLIGTFGMLALLRWSASALSTQVGWVRSFLEHNTLVATVVSVGLVLAVALLRRGGSTAEAQTPGEEPAPGEPASGEQRPPAA